MRQTTKEHQRKDSNEIWIPWQAVAVRSLRGYSNPARTCRFSALDDHIRRFCIAFNKYHDWLPWSMDHLLAEVSRGEHEWERGLRSASMATRSRATVWMTSQMNRGFDVSNPEGFWLSEFTIVTEYWKNHSSRRLAW